MGEPKLEKSLTINDAAKAFNKSPDFIRKYIRLGVIPVVQFAGKPIKPYRMLYKDLESLFTVAALGSLKIGDLGKRLGRKPSEKEAFQWPE
jgi:hypothetical protein